MNKLIILFLIFFTGCNSEPQKRVEVKIVECHYHISPYSGDTLMDYKYDVINNTDSQITVQYYSFYDTAIALYNYQVEYHFKNLNKLSSSMADWVMTKDTFILPKSSIRFTDRVWAFDEIDTIGGRIWILDNRGNREMVKFWQAVNPTYPK